DLYRQANRVVHWAAVRSTGHQPSVSQKAGLGVNPSVSVAPSLAAVELYVGFSTKTGTSELTTMPRLASPGPTPPWLAEPSACTVCRVLAGTTIVAVRGKPGKPDALL